MKALRACTISVGLLLVTTAANAQGAPQGAGSQGAGSGRYQPASDFAEPYADAPPPPPPAAAYEPPPPRVTYGSPEYGNGYGGYGPAVLPPREVYAVLRENGFSPLGAPRLRGFFYSIAAIDRRGDDGRLVIDARDGRIVRFVPADHFGRYGGYGYGGDGYYGAPPPRPSYGPLEPMTRLDSPPPAPRIASRTPATVPMPKAAPSRPAGEPPVAAKPAPALPATQQSAAATQVKPVDAPPAAPVAAKPAPVIQPTQPMPKVQDLE
jgi:hypothetical protein